MDCSAPGCSVHGNSPGKNTWVDCHALLQGIFPTQELKQGLLHCRRILYQLSYPGSPYILKLDSKISFLQCFSFLVNVYVLYCHPFKSKFCNSAFLWFKSNTFFSKPKKKKKRKMQISSLRPNHSSFWCASSQSLLWFKKSLSRCSGGWEWGGKQRNEERMV